MRGLARLLLFSAASLFAVAPLARGVAESGVGGRLVAQLFICFAPGASQPGALAGRLGPKDDRSACILCQAFCSGLAPLRGAARPDRRDARPELHARADGGGLRRADAPSQPSAPPARAAGGLALRRETACVGVNLFSRRRRGPPLRLSPFRRDCFPKGMLMNELITGVVLETLCAILAASYFVAECAMQEAKIPARRKRRPGA